MTPQLRRWHRLIWPILLGGFLCLAWGAQRVLPEPTFAFGESREPVRASRVGQALELYMPDLANGKSATLLVYLSNSAETELKKAFLIGRVSQTKETFPLDESAMALSNPHIHIYDPIQQVFIYQQKLQ